MRRHDNFIIKMWNRFLSRFEDFLKCLLVFHRVSRIWILLSLLLFSRVKTASQVHFDLDSKVLSIIRGIEFRKSPANARSEADFHLVPRTDVRAGHPCNFPAISSIIYLFILFYRTRAGGRYHRRYWRSTRESSDSFRRVRNNLLNYRMPKVTSTRREADERGRAGGAVRRKE